MQAVLPTPALGLDGIRHFHEQQPMACSRVENHAFLVTALVRVVLDVGVTEHRLPPPIQFLLGNSDILLRLATLATLVWILRTTPTETVDVAPPPR